MIANGPPVVDLDGENRQAARPLILVVEDQCLITTMIGHVHQAARSNTSFVPTGEAALAVAKTVDHLSVLGTDIHLMHGIDGRSVLRALRRGSPALPAVVITGFGKAAPEAALGHWPPV